jgi:O-acetyl-ADP-ribose deacetylase (regulator of RNase III)
MVEITHGDILAADAEALVNTVNTVGVMGRGIALQFKKAYPENFSAYEAACRRGEVRIGQVLVHELARLGEPRFIINFPTKEHWRGASRLEYVESGLAALAAEVRARGIRSIAVPPLGCGLGGLSWGAVRPRIEAAFAELPEVRVLLYEPAGAPAPARQARSAAPPRMTLGSAVCLQLIHRYLGGLMDPHVTLLEIHKLAYLMQACGQSLNLRFEKGPYGPYARNLRHVLHKLEGHYVEGYGDGEDAPTRPLELRPAAADVSAEFVAGHRETAERLERVTRLIAGFESPYGMELLATVHWVAARESAPDVDAAIRAVHAWSDRKRAFPERHIRIAWETLLRHGWLPAAGKAA